MILIPFAANSEIVVVGDQEDASSWPASKVRLKKRSALVGPQMIRTPTAYRPRESKVSHYTQATYRKTRHTKMGSGHRAGHRQNLADDRFVAGHRSETMFWVVRRHVRSF